MKVIVYGTLKRGYGNNRLLSTSKFIEPRVVHGYRLYNSGFPVARASGPEDSIIGELWELDGPGTLQSLDWLEGEGRMYIRTLIEEDTYMYVGPDEFWNFDGETERLHKSWRRDKLPLCPQNAEGHYEWSR